MGLQSSEQQEDTNFTYFIISLWPTARVTLQIVAYTAALVFLQGPRNMENPLV